MRKVLILLVVLGVIGIAYKLTDSYCTRYENNLATAIIYLARQNCRTNSCVQRYVDAYYKAREKHVCRKLGFF